ncbi:hypothetical protein FYK55_17485 [Roseiconus nitratireducens]|uniref:BON domain-containing protein n=1 Tax=Roseiconus nitratireducens TaxID=2605748 RepID=A0A5M6D1K9_9BACT|nr:hypothetical protein [Roseiconus nitratireducens]KAA5541364.1 hypothetical protein FYK55_17485 [Roseiconus nitratireducens]
MVTTQILESRESRTIRRIDSVLEAHHELSPYRPSLQISIEGARIVLRGHLPTTSLRQALVPAIRQAGVLGEICNCVEVA